MLYRLDPPFVMHDLGPGAGNEGGQIVFEGTPSDIVSARSTLTGKHLADYVRANNEVGGAPGSGLR